MGYLQDWVSQLVLIVILAVVLELLLPTGGFEKYVKFVVGLVLIVALLDPVIKLLHIDPDQIIRGIRSDQGDRQLSEETNRQKKEIVQAQDAYIQKQMAVQMKKQVKEELHARYGLQIEAIELRAADRSNATTPIKKVTVVLGKEATGGSKSYGSSSVRPVQDVSVDIGASGAAINNGKKLSDREKKIRALLAERWGIDKERISLDVKKEE